MPQFSADEIRARFEFSREFNEIFEAFQSALEQRLDGIDLYRTLFWNQALKPEELCLFCDKVAKEFPTIAYDSYMWLANVFEATYAGRDNFELAVTYYQKAASARPADPDPYIDAADCYDPQLKIPPAQRLIEFLKSGTQHVLRPTQLYHRIALLYELDDNDEMSSYYRRIASHKIPPPERRQPDA